ncbi:MAG: aspartate aminotransferase family protein [Crinalium sp.]
MSSTQTIPNIQQQHLQNFITSYTQRTKTSKQLAQTHRPVLADNKTIVEFNPAFKEMFYPIVGKRSHGSRIWDIDNNEYIDLIMGFGINLFGHNPDFIKEALQEQLEKGIQIGPQAELAGEVAQLFSELTGMERVAFSNTGTEAVMTALRLARAATNRPKIAMFSGSYHGHFDGTLVKQKNENGNLKTVPLVPGITSNFIADILILDYGNPQSLEIIKAHAHELAAVIVEPVQSRRPNLQPKTFLHQLRQLATELGIVLIFDEMVTGFRIHPGGAQAWFGVQADIATYGKIVGGGMPIGVIAGKANIMDAIDGGTWNYGDTSSPQAKTTFFAGTFCKHPLSLAAAKAVLQYLKSQGSTLQEQLNQRTTEFVATLNAYFEAEELPIQMTNFGSLFGPVASGGSAQSENAESSGMDLLYYHLVHRGVMLRGGGGFLSTAHTDTDLEYILDAVKSSIQDLRSGFFLPPRSSKVETVVSATK